MTIVKQQNGSTGRCAFGPEEIKVAPILSPENGILLLSRSTSETFHLTEGHFVFAYGREGKRTVLKVDVGIIGDMLASISIDTRKTLAIETNDTIRVSSSVAPQEIDRIAISPIPETLKALSSGLSIFDDILRPYLERRLVLHSGDYLTIWHTGQQVCFKVGDIAVELRADPYGIITENTIVHFPSTPADAAWVNDLEIHTDPLRKFGRSSVHIESSTVRINNVSASNWMQQIVILPPSTESSAEVDIVTLSSPVTFVNRTSTDASKSCLLRTIRNGDETFAIELLGKGADPNATDDYGAAITQAIRKGYEALAIELLRKGADPNATDDYGAAITQAIRKGYEALAIELLRKGADPNANDEYGTALGQAIRRKYEGLAINLLNHGADPNKSDSYGHPLQQAMTHKLQELVSGLLKVSTAVI